MATTEDFRFTTPVLLHTASNPGKTRPLVSWCFRVWRWSFPIGSTLAILTAGRDFSISRIVPGSMPFWYWLTGELAVFWFWCLFAPLVLAMMDRFPIEGSKWARNLVNHLATFVGLTLLYTFYYWTVDRILTPSGARAAIGFLHSFSLAASDGIIKYYLPIVAAGYIAFYYARLQQEEVRSVRLASELTTAQLATLKMQLQPHFLFNTLHSISSLVYTDAEAADRMIVQLSELLRMTLNQSSADLVPLRREIEHVGKYLAIEQTRFSDQLSVELDIDPECQDIYVPSLLLQPIVENSVKHGIAKSTERGRIVVTAKTEGDRLCVWIEDNGPDPIRSSPTGDGIGLKNTRERLQRVYQDDFEIQLSRSDDEITTVKLVLPIEPHRSLTRAKNEQAV